MDDELNFLHLAENEDQLQMLRLGHQSPPHSSYYRHSLLEASTASSSNLNPQLPTLDDFNFEWPSFDEFEESSNFVRVRELIELMKFEIDDTTSHADRLNIDDREPMMHGELRVRLKDLQRIHRDISTTFQELEKLKLNPEDRQTVSELFRHHAIIYASASTGYEQRIERARSKKSNFRIDFRDSFTGNVSPKFSKTLRSGDIALLPTSLEQPAPLFAATPQKPVTAPLPRREKRASFRFG